MTRYISQVKNRFKTSCILGNIAVTNEFLSCLSKQEERKKKGKEVYV
jgi:hypothetical protein